MLYGLVYNMVRNMAHIMQVEAMEKRLKHKL